MVVRLSASEEVALELSRGGGDALRARGQNPGTLRRPILVGLVRCPPGGSHTSRARQAFDSLHPTTVS